MVEGSMEIWRLMVDFGLVILVWMTQLIVYPSFTYFEEVALGRWHQKYTSNITFIVAPLMFAQVGIITWQLFTDLHWFHLTSAVLVALVWVNTFFFAVPKHEQITRKNVIRENSVGLAKVNWYRTALWTVIWLLGLADYYFM